MGTGARCRPWWAECGGELGKRRQLAQARLWVTGREGKGEEKWYLTDAGIKPALLGFSMRMCETVSGHRGGVVGISSGCWERSGNTVGASETAICFHQ